SVHVAALVRPLRGPLAGVQRGAVEVVGEAALPVPAGGLGDGSAAAVRSARRGCRPREAAEQDGCQYGDRRQTGNQQRPRSFDFHVAHPDPYLPVTCRGSLNWISEAREPYLLGFVEATVPLHPLVSSRPARSRPQWWPAAGSSPDRRRC